ncbi:hypothetical protein [Ktedonospora formicarum]|uniref:Uncharacterized protein n=1 Tax=Ktedonospora formicarum TaxID=2778364 RepID=A0A8J3HQS7_9CHLR|nr:hypothetical protein [Ktedonospora formicarum]GHO42107.1 hypothetical protein KSX_02700 [Ktedonospora formicarum]
MAKGYDWIDRFIEPQTTPEGKQKHGGCLIIWLMLALLSCVTFFAVSFTGFNVPKGYFLQYIPPSITSDVHGLDLLNIVLDLLICIGIIGIWRWKKWGYYLILGINLLQFALDSILVQIPHLIHQHSYNFSSLLGLGIAYTLIHQELKYLRQK